MVRKHRVRKGWRIISQRKLDRVRGEFEKSRMTYVELATEIKDYHPDRVRDFLNGKTVEIELFKRLADHFGEDYNDLREPDLCETIPREAVSYFSGNSRRKLVERIATNLRRSKPIAICGRGGAGKTELVLQLVTADKKNKRFKGGYCFVRARDASAIGLQLERFIDDCIDSGLITESLSPLTGSEKIQWFYKAYSFTNRLILLIFDSVGQYQDIAPFLPPEKAYFRVLITTRRRDLPATVIQTIPLEDFDSDDAMELLTEKIRKNTKLAISNPEHLKALEDIALAVGFLPLALEIIGGYLASRMGKNSLFSSTAKRLKGDSGLAPILNRIENTGYFNERIVDGGLLAELQEKGLEAVFNLSWQSFNEKEKEVAYVLSLFAPEAVWYELLRDSFSDYDEQEFEDILYDTLRDQSFVDETDGSDFQYHDLTRTFVRGVSEAETTYEQCELRIINSLSLYALKQSHIFSRRNIQLLNHIEYVMQGEQSDDEDVRLFFYDTAIEAFRTFKSNVHQARLDTESQRVMLSDDTYYQTGNLALDEATRFEHLAVLHLQEYDYEIALEKIMQAIAAMEVVCDENDNTIGYTVKLIEMYFTAIDICLSLDNSQQARGFYDLVQMISGIHDGEDGQIIFLVPDAYFRFYEGRILRCEAKHEEAIDCFIKAKNLFLKSLGKKKVEVENNVGDANTMECLLSSLDSLVHLYFDLRRIEEALNCFKERERVLKALSTPAVDDGGLCEDYLAIGLRCLKILRTNPEGEDGEVEDLKNYCLGNGIQIYLDKKSEISIERLSKIEDILLLLIKAEELNIESLQ